MSMRYIFFFNAFEMPKWFNFFNSKPFNLNAINCSYQSMQLNNYEWSTQSDCDGILCSISMNVPHIYFPLHRSLNQYQGYWVSVLRGAKKQLACYLIELCYWYESFVLIENVMCGCIFNRLFCLSCFTVRTLLPEHEKWMLITDESSAIIEYHML